MCVCVCVSRNKQIHTHTYIYALHTHNTHTQVSIQRVFIDEFVIVVSLGAYPITNANSTFSRKYNNTPKKQWDSLVSKSIEMTVETVQFKTIIIHTFINTTTVRGVRTQIVVLVIMASSFYYYYYYCATRKINVNYFITLLMCH